jgi:integrase/recombinase XerD
MPSTPKAPSAIIAQRVRLARRERLSYDEFSYVCQRARKPLGLTQPPRARKLPQLLTADE